MVSRRILRGVVSWFPFQWLVGVLSHREQKDDCDKRKKQSGKVSPSSREYGRVGGLFYSRGYVLEKNKETDSILNVVR